MLKLAALLSKGCLLPDGSISDSIRIIYQSAEDSNTDTIKPCLEQMGADCNNIAYVVDDEETNSPEHDSVMVPHLEYRKRNGFVLNGQRFVKRISELAGWSLTDSHLVIGVYNRDLNMLEFDLSRSIIE